MDFSGTQREVPPMAMHAGGSPYLGLHHEHEHQNHGANGRHMSPPDVEEEEEASKNRQALAVVPVSSGSGGGGGGMRYRECLKNHAAAIGGSATDGCGEFMPAGEEGSLDALRCSACGCHRNFHRKEPPSGGDSVGGRPLHHHHHQQLGGGPLSPLHPHHPHHHRGLLVAALPTAPTRMVMPLSAMHQHHHATSAESDDPRGPGQQQTPPPPPPPGPGGPPARKRFRTKFTAEQKARMLGFAEEAGWRLQKLEDAVVQRFCQEVGVKRRVLKVWMHNNKHTLARRGHGVGEQPQQHLHHYHRPTGDGADDGLLQSRPEPSRSPSRSRSPPPPPPSLPPQQQQLRVE